MTQLKAGAGAAEVNLEKVLPIEGFNTVANPLHVRALILDGNIRLVFISGETTSLPNDSINRFKERICELTGTQPENIWVTFTHSFASPHVFPAPKPGSEPRGPKKSPEDIAKGALLADAYFEAMEKAVKTALETLQPAVMGAGEGQSFVNTSRNVLTKDGWAVGSDDDSICSRALKVLRVDSAEGKPLAIIYNYCLRSCVMSRLQDENGSTVISSDLCGAVCERLEDAFGSGLVTIFLNAAATDQDPRYKSHLTLAGIEGEGVEIDFTVEESKVLLKAQSIQLASDVLKVWRGITADQKDADFSAGSVEVICDKKQANPSGDYRNAGNASEWIPDGQETQTVYGVKLGALNIVGVQPEIDSITAMGLSAAGEGKLTMNAIMVNGSGKALTGKAAYDLRQFPGLHSPYMPGTSEKLIEAAKDLIKGL